MNGLETVVNNKDQNSNPTCSSMNSVNVESNLNIQNADIAILEEDSADDYNDIDLSDIVPSVIDPSLTMNDKVSLMGGNESYKEMINVCSSTAETLKKTISDVLNSRGSVVITEVDDASELEASLNKKIADFNNTVHGCLNNSVSPQVSEKLNNNTALKNVEKDSGVREKSGSCSEKNQDTPKEMSISSVSKTDVDSSVEKTNVIKSETDNINLSNKASNDKNEDSSKEASSFEDSKSSKKLKNTSYKKKGERTIDQILKSLSTFTSTEEKLQQLCKKYLDTLEELRLVEPRIRQLEKQTISQQREKESLQSELNRMILAKSTLESLCRELQRQNKAVKEESIIRIKEEEEKRKEIGNKFQSTLNDISALMQENSKRNTALRDENAELSQKLKMLIDNYSVWEENTKKVVQHKELEAQLANAKHAKINLELKQETEKFLREKQSLLEELANLQERCTFLTTNELQLRTELGDYISKYEEFQSVLTNSSKVFQSFKTDMDATSKKIKKLEKETNVYKQKWESSNKALLDMINNKEKQEKENANAQQRILTLEKLCRALQIERNELRNELNAITASCSPEEQLSVPSPSIEPVELPINSQGCFMN